MGKLQSKHGKVRRHTTRDKNLTENLLQNILQQFNTITPCCFSPSSLPRLKRVNAEKTPKVSAVLFVCLFFFVSLSTT